MGKRKFFCLLLVFLLLCTPARAMGSILTGETLPLDAYAAYLLNLDTGAVLYTQHADEVLEPASLTKIMTALLVVERGSLDDSVTVSQSALDALYANDTAEYSTIADLQAGEVISLRSLLYCILVSSSSDACCVAAEAVSGSVEAFIDRMNERAAELGCTRTHFSNPHGLHEADHYTTASDLAKITIAALQHDEFVDICNTPSVELPATNLHELRYLKTTNYLLSSNTVGGYVYNRACGVKTGYTSQAGYCLVSTAQNSRMSLLGVVMGASATRNEDNSYTIHSFTDMVTLFEYGFNRFTSASLLSTLDMVAEVPVTLGAGGTDSVVLSPVRSVRTMLPADYDKEKIQRNIALDQESVEAPVEAGQILGKVNVYYDGQWVDTVELAAISGVERSAMEYWKQRLLLYWEKPVVKLVTILIAALLLLWLLRMAFPRRKARR